MFKEGSIAPDKLDNASRHHYGRQNTIENYLGKARDSYLRQNPSDAFWYLGNACHYIQDSWTHLDSSHPKHDDWEQWIEDSWFNNDLTQVVDKAKLSYHYRGEYRRIIDALSYQPIGRKRTYEIATVSQPEESQPFIDLNFSYKICLVVAKSILGQKYSSELQDRLNGLYERSYYELYDVEKDKAESIRKQIQTVARLGNKQGFLRILYRPVSFFLGLKLSIETDQYRRNEHLLKEIRKYRHEAESLQHYYEDWYLANTKDLNYEHITKCDF